MFVSNDHSYGPSTSTSPKKSLEVQGILRSSDNFNDKLNSDDREEEDKITSKILYEDNKKEPSYALLENKEDKLDTDETGKENKNTSEIVVENEGRNTEELNVEIFKKPLSKDENVL